MEKIIIILFFLSGYSNEKYKLCFLFISIFSLLCTFSCSNSSDAATNINNTDFGIKYSFYLTTTTDQTWACVSGLEGSVVPTVASPEKPGYRFTGWKTKSGDSIPAVFGNVKLSFYAQWADINTVKQIGSKSAPDAVGDIIFTDGSASPYPEDWNSLTEAQWKSAVAMLFTTTYNPTNGQNVKGGQYQYKLAAGLVVATSKEWCKEFIENKVDYTPSGSGQCTWNSSLYKFRLWNSLFIGYSWNENAYRTKTVLPQLSLSTYFGRQNLVDSSNFKLLADETVSPAFKYVIDYGKNLEMTSDFRDDWYLPSTGELKILLQDEEIRQKYSRLLQKKNSFLSQDLKDFKLLVISNDTEFWSSSTGSQEVNSIGYIAHGSNRGQEGYNEEKVYWGTTSETPPSTHEIWLYDPYSGFEGTPQVSITPVYGLYGSGDGAKGEGIFTREDCNSFYIEKDKYGYAYKTAFYIKAYKVNYKGIISYDEKSKGHAVIPVRVF